MKLTRSIRESNAALRFIVRRTVQDMVGAAGNALEKLSRRGHAEIADRNRRRRKDSLSGWFLAEELSMIRDISRLVVPSGDGPGAEEAGVVEQIDRIIKGAPDKQALYVRGLVALDSLAQRTVSHRFVMLSQAAQHELLVYIDTLHAQIHRTPSLAAKIHSVALTLRCRWDGSWSALELFPVVVRDVMQAFYTSQVCWDWLGYEGPPMPHGYSDALIHPKVLTDKHQ
jgi:hypothetical protein